MITCGGQATIPMVLRRLPRHAGRLRRDRGVRRLACRPGPGTRANIDEFTRTTAAGVEVIGGARAGQGDHHPQPGRPADDHARHDLLRAAGPTPTPAAIAASIDGDGRPRCQRTCPATGCAASRSSTPSTARRRPGRDLPRGRGRRRLPAAVRRQPRHHDRRRRPGSARRSPRLARSWRTEGAPMPYSDTTSTSGSPTRRLRDGSHAKRHQFTDDEVRGDRRARSTPPACRSSR